MSHLPPNYQPSETKKAHVPRGSTNQIPVWDQLSPWEHIDLAFQALPLFYMCFRQKNMLILKEPFAKLDAGEKTSKQILLRNSSPLTEEVFFTRH